MHKVRFIFFAIACFLSHKALAEIEFRGFASFVAGISSESKEDLTEGKFNSDPASLAGRYPSNNLNFKPDSLFALQMDTELGDGLSATMQLISKGKNDYEPEIEWSYITYQFNEKLQFSAGRLRLPFYRYSDYVDVRYAYNWLKPPNTVYFVDENRFEGVSLLYEESIGPVDTVFQFVASGSFEGDIEENVSGFYEDNFAINLTANYDWFTFRLGYQYTGDTTITFDNPTDPFNFLLAGFDQLALGIQGGLVNIPGFDAGSIASDFKKSRDNLVADGDSSSFLGTSIHIDTGGFLLDAEYIEFAVDNSFFPASDAYYVTAGYRFSDFVMFATTGKRKGEATEDFIDPIRAYQQIPGLGAQVSQFTNALLEASRQEINLVGVGIRYDFHSSASLKLQYDKEDYHDGSDASLFRAAIDLMF